MYMLLYSLVVATVAASAQTNSAVETEMFAIPISPNLFNWTYQEFDQQYRFHAALEGMPTLPSWLRYIYSGRHHSGFIFGTPPRGSAGKITLEVIGLNRQDYETRRVTFHLDIKRKEKIATHEVELKIDNLNVEDLLDEHKMTRLKDILRTKLWPESSGDLYATFLASAIDLGARLPLKPSDGEGLVVRLGSSAPFSEELKRLREEVRPLSRLPSCPREYKRTTVERLFRDAGLTLDWCSFELFNTVYKERSTEHVEYLSDIPSFSKSTNAFNMLNTKTWNAPNRAKLPSRSYGKMVTTAVMVPMSLWLLCVTALTATVCMFQASVSYGKLVTTAVMVPLSLFLLCVTALTATVCMFQASVDPVSKNFLDNIFHICIDYRNRRANKSKVELCRYGTGNTEQSQVADNVSTKSAGVSPNNSLARPYSPKSLTNIAANYNRPQPPPYIGSNTNSLHHRKSGEKTPATSPEHRTHLLEESLKLLNEAKLPIKDPIIDLNDGSEDYVPIKQNLDDIDVPDLGKFGIGGNI